MDRIARLGATAVGLWACAAAACAAADVQAQRAAHHPNTAPSPVPIVELIQNPGAEEGLGSSDDAHIVKPAYWITTGNFTVVQYGASGYFPGTPKISEPITERAGKNFFAGGPGAEPESSARQRVDLARGANAKAGSGHMRVSFSAWIGGWYTQRDYGTVTLTFSDGSKVLSCKGKPCVTTLGPVTREQREGKIELLCHSETVDVPKGARFADVVMTAHRFSGGFDDAYFDNVSLKLVAPKQRVPDACAGAPRPKPDLAQKTDVSAFGSIGQFCLRINAAIFGAAFAFLLGSFVWKMLRRGPWGRRYRVRGAIAGGVALIVFAATFLGLPSPQLGKFSLGDIGCPNQAWLWSSLAFIGMFAFFATTLLWIYRRRRRASFVPTHLRPRHSPRRRGAWSRWWPKHWVPSKWRLLVVWRNAEIVAVYVNAVLLAAVLAMIGLVEYPPSSYELAAFNQTLAICAVAVIYAAIAFAPSMDQQGIPRVVRVGLFLLLLAPTFQPLEQAAILSSKEQARYASEKEHKVLTMDRPALAYDNVVFEVPASLDITSSSRVIFSARRVSPDLNTTDCLTPVLVAPGFDVAGVLDEPIPVLRRDLTWQWIITPKRTGSQDVFASVLYSPNCKRFSADAGGSALPAAVPSAEPGARATHGEGGPSRPGFDPVFTTQDTAYVSRPWYSVDYLNAISGSLGAIIAIVTTVFGLFGLRRPDPASPPAKPPGGPEGGESK